MTEYLSALRAKDSTPYTNLIMNTDAEKQILLNILQEEDNKGIEEKVAEKEEEDEEKEELEEKEEKEEDEDTTLTNIEKETTVHPLMESVGEIQVKNSSIFFLNKFKLQLFQNTFINALKNRLYWWNVYDKGVFENRYFKHIIPKLQRKINKTVFFI